MKLFMILLLPLAAMAAKKPDGKQQHGNLRALMEKEEDETLAYLRTEAQRALWTEQQTGFFYDDGATKGFVLLAPFRGIGTYLIDVDGKVVRSWIEPDGLTPGASVYLTKEGTLLKAVRTEGSGGDGGRIREYSSDGSCIWEFRYDNESSPAAPGQQHHDFEVLPNGNLLVTARTGNEDTILEIKRNGKLNKNWNQRAEYPGTGSLETDFDNTCKRVLDGASKNFKAKWKWSSAEHRGTGARKIDTTKLPTVNFNHIDYLPGRDHILVSCNVCNEIFIIDHKPNTIQSSREAGDLLWRWGTPSNYGASGNPLLGFTHGAHWIYNDDSYGWSGFNENEVGDIILFNNRDPELCDPMQGCTGRAGFSSVVQLSPPWNNKEKDYGSPQKGFAFGPASPKRRIVNFSHDQTPYDIDSDFQGSAQLLPGNRIMMTIGAVNNNDSTDRAQGDIYELKPGSGSSWISVWRYVNPFIPPEEYWPQNNGPKPLDVELGKLQNVELCDANNFGFKCNSVFRGIKYAYNFDGITPTKATRQQKLHANK